MDIKQIEQEYTKIADFLNERWPLKTKQQRTFARTMKIVEELGELADEILTSMNLQRNTKISQFTKQNIEDEFADVLASLVLLGIELDIDISEVIKRKIEFTRRRFEMDSEES